MEVTGRVRHGDWSIEWLRGRAAELHANWDGDSRAVRINEVTHPALVLSSTQRRAILDPNAIEEGGFDVVTRRSGGGLVHLLPAAQIWVDFFLPRGDPLWVDDVSLSAEWLGGLWTRALADVVRPYAWNGDLAVHGGRWTNPGLGRLVCFSAIGPGEVTSGDRKVVGISQRRGRAGARFQCTAYVEFSAEVILGALAAEAVGPETGERLRRALEAGVAVIPSLGAHGSGPHDQDAVRHRVLDALVGRLP